MACSLHEFIYCSTIPGGGQEGWTFVCIMCIIGAMKSAAVIKRLEAAGWRLVAVRGSHHQFKHPDKPGRITVPHPKKDLGVGLVRAIFKQAGLSEE